MANYVAAPVIVDMEAFSRTRRERASRQSSRTNGMMIRVTAVAVWLQSRTLQFIMPVWLDHILHDNIYCTQRELSR